jgi:hypothetical protein
MSQDTVISINRDTIHKYLNNHGFTSLSKIISHMYSKNPYNINNKGSEEIKHTMWNEQCYINFPLLYISSIYLYFYAKERKCNKFLFVTRDCCHWYKIFKHLFPNEDVHYFHASRNMLEKAMEVENHPYDTYVNDIIGDDVEQCIFVDIHGTGKRIFSYFDTKYKTVPHYFLLSSTYKKMSSFPDITLLNSNKFINLLFDIRGSPIEMLNYDVIGTLQNYTIDGPVRDLLEYDIKLINVYHKTINNILKYVEPIDTNPSRSKYKTNNLKKLIDHLGKFITIDKPIISKHIKHIGKHKNKK